MWVCARSTHFEVYSQAGEQQSRALAQWLEEVRAFFSTRVAGISKNERVQVLEFGSQAGYTSVRPRESADAFFAGAGGSEYIVLPPPGSNRYGVAAHEYAHAALHSAGVSVPPWIGEGMAEVLAGIRIRGRSASIGGDLPARSETLRRAGFIPLPELLTLGEDAPLRADRAESSVFYAESWALTNMLLFSPAYQAHSAEFWNELSAGNGSEQVFRDVYGKQLDVVARDLRAWIDVPKRGMTIPDNVSPDAAQVQVSSVDSFSVRRVIAGLFLTSGDLELAQQTFADLAKERSRDWELPAKLGEVALKKNDKEQAQAEWRRAFELGASDADLCYQYAILLQNSGGDRAEIRSALERAVALRPTFDDARYQLALLEGNAGEYAQEIAQLRAMRSVAPGRSYGYWTALASALIEADQRDAAKEAARKAGQFATTSEEQAAAVRLGYEAETDLTVQVARDGNGDLQMITTRKPHGDSDWNPFIEPDDRIRSVAGRIQQVECVDGKISGFRITDGSAAFEVSVPDPSRVLIAGGKAEFVCGAEDGREVDVQYAASQSDDSGILRGMRFKRTQ